MTETPMRERMARAAWDARYDDGEFDYAKFLATETEDGGNGRYLLIMAQVDAILAELERPSEGMLEAANELDITAEVDSAIQVAAIHGVPLKPYAPDNTPLMQWFVAMIRAAREGK